MGAWWKEFISLTPIERKAAWLVGAAFAVGIGLRWFNLDLQDAPKFDYRESDSLFAALSERAARDSAAASAPSASAPVNLNTATKQELMRLPGVGEVTAERIVLYREEYGPFQSVQDLLNISGIGERKLQKLTPLITVH